jgi:hypothetical protein
LADLLTYDEDVAFSLADHAATVSAIVRRTPDERLRATRFGDWSAKEVIGHLADGAEIFAERVRRCIEEADPELAAFDPDELARERNNQERDAMELSRRLQAAHGSMIQLLQRPGAAASTGRHSERGTVTAGHLAAYQARHAGGHIAELQQAFPPS